MRHLPSQYHCSWPKSMFVLRFHLTFSQTKIIWYVQADIFIKAAENGDLAQVRKSIAASVPINCRDQVRNYLSLSVTMIITVSSPHIHISLCHSIFFLTLSRKPCRTIILSMPHLFVRFTMSLLPRRIYLWFCHFHLLSLIVQLKSPLFLTASLIILYHLLFISLFLTETCDYFSLSQCFLSITLFLYLYIYFSLFDNKILCLSLLFFGPSQSPTSSLSLSLSPMTVHSFIPFNSSLYLYPSLALIVVALFYICLYLSASLPCAQCI